MFTLTFVFVWSSEKLRVLKDFATNHGFRFAFRVEDNIELSKTMNLQEIGVYLSDLAALLASWFNAVDYEFSLKHIKIDVEGDFVDYPVCGKYKAPAAIDGLEPEAGSWVRYYYTGHSGFKVTVLEAAYFSLVVNRFGRKALLFAKMVRAIIKVDKAIQDLEKGHNIHRALRSLNQARVELRAILNALDKEE